MRGLFISYHSRLSKKGEKWIISENQKFAASDVLSTTRPDSLRERLESDFSFSQHELKTNFQHLFKQAVKLSEAFQIMDSVPKRRSKKIEDKQSWILSTDKPTKEKTMTMKHFSVSMSNVKRRVSYISFATAKNVLLRKKNLKGQITTESENRAVEAH